MYSNLYSFIMSNPYKIKKHYMRSSALWSQSFSDWNVCQYAKWKGPPKPYPHDTEASGSTAMRRQCFRPVLLSSESEFWHCLFWKYEISTCVMLLFTFLGTHRWIHPLDSLYFTHLDGISQISQLCKSRVIPHPGSSCRQSSSAFSLRNLFPSPGVQDFFNWKNGPAIV